MKENESRPLPAAHGRRHSESTARGPCFHRQYTTVGVGSQPIFVGGRCVGYVAGGVFVKSVRGSVHQLRRPPAWCLDAGSLDEAEALGALRVEIYDTETGNRYTASVRLIREKGFALDRGFGRQIGLPLELWQVQRPGEANAQQLPLPWAEVLHER